MLLVELECEELLLFIWLLEPGPVVLIEELQVLPELVWQNEPDPLFDTIECTSVWLLFEAEPVWALPPFVLPLTLAFPLDALCQLFECELKLLLFQTEQFELLLLLIWLLDPGPVFDILAT